MDYSPTQPTVVEDDIEQPPSPSPEASSSRVLSTPSIPQSDKGKSRDEDIDSSLDQEPLNLEAERPSTPYPTLPEQPAPSSSTHDQSDPQNTIIEPTPTATPTEASEPDPGLRQAPASSQPSAAPPSRHFPPPGTLVVVQGIVHTTDVSRSQSSSSGPEGDHGSTRARGPLDMFRRSRPPSSSNPHLPESDPANDLPPPPPAADNSSRSNSSISPGSIDVLGTLLSVAAAATAASLLTGSSEPILASGLAPPGTGSEQQQEPHLQPQPQPQQHHEEQGAGVGVGGDDSIYARRRRPTEYPPSPDNYATTRAERMRQAWSTIRERLGLRPNPPASQPSLGSNGNTQTGDLTNAPVTDTRELMLAEMARAFNIGLGLNGLGGSPNSSSTADEQQRQQDTGSEHAAAEGEASASSSPSQMLPPEGSFDRFLVDLQADLRVALTREDDREEEVVGSQGRQGVQDEHHQTSPIAQDSSTELPPPLVPIDAGESQDTMSGPPPPLEDSRSDDSTTTVERLPSRASSVTELLNLLNNEEAEDRTNDPDLDDMPSLQSLSDSESEMGDDDDEDLHTDFRGQDLDDLFSSLPLPTPSPPPRSNLRSTTTAAPAVPSASNATTSENLGASTSASSSTRNNNTGPSNATASSSTSANATGNTGIGSGRMDASGRINWWRLYRFPAITSSPRNSASGPPSTTPSAGSPFRPADETSTPTSVPANPMEAGGATSSATATGTEGVSATPAPFLPTFLPPPVGQTVVPVIVVGLQSVAANLNFGGAGPAAGAAGLGGGAPPPVPGHQHHDEEDLAGLGSGFGGMGMGGREPENGRYAMGMDEEDDHDIFGLGERSGSTEGTTGASGYNDEHDDGGRDSTRGWHSRAANAFRNLRPGAAGAHATTGRGVGDNGARGSRTMPRHNHANATPLPFNAPGSRTFLIYVIGGYYPPDHNIVTGGPESFESFEALL
ncbi:hypothetical protein EST38_g7434 [Candolleomyces aberdarensis]|uniref:Uncharacterized protein n=1 Tax=Candolleomyces aberdarensis TaxID=2316362 RepID=A0A4Q2DH53_9AGAR|nr:hypothetical protein EST38_g7434 [Candolleomyces aberdarensis]